MGIDAENTVEEVTLDETVESLETQEPEAVESQEGELEAEQATQAKELTQEQLNARIQRRVKREKQKTEQATSEVEELKEKLRLKDEREKLLQLSLEQAKSESKANDGPPSPDDFDDGEYDPAFKQKQEEYRLKQIREAAADAVAKAEAEKAQESQQQEMQRERIKRQEEHYRRSFELEVSDFEETEDAALSVLGESNVNAIIENYDDSHTIIYHLGKNKDKAKRIAQLASTNPAKALIELAKISAHLEIKPVNSHAPNPVEELEGSGHVSLNAFQRKDAEMTKKYDKGEITLNDLLSFRRQQGQGAK